MLQARRARERAVVAPAVTGAASAARRERRRQAGQLLLPPRTVVMYCSILAARSRVARPYSLSSVLTGTLGAVASAASAPSTSACASEHSKPHGARAAAAYWSGRRRCWLAHAPRAALRQRQRQLTLGTAAADGAVVAGFRQLGGGILCQLSGTACVAGGLGGLVRAHGWRLVAVRLVVVRQAASGGWCVLPGHDAHVCCDACVLACRFQAARHLSAGAASGRARLRAAANRFDRALPRTCCGPCCHGPARQQRGLREQRQPPARVCCCCRRLALLPASSAGAGQCGIRQAVCRSLCCPRQALQCNARHPGAAGTGAKHHTSTTGQATGVACAHLAAALQVAPAIPWLPDAAADAAARADVRRQPAPAPWRSATWRCILAARELGRTMLAFRCEWCDGRSGAGGLDGGRAGAGVVPGGARGSCGACSFAGQQQLLLLLLALSEQLLLSVL